MPIFIASGAARTSKRPGLPGNLRRPEPPTARPAGIASLGDENQLSAESINQQDRLGTSQPGRYVFKFGWLTISAEDLAEWERYPNAVFAYFRTVKATEEAGEDFRGTFELQKNISEK
jgi:hypothetical protein